MARYQHYASWYDRVSAEWVYRVGREHAIAALGLSEGSRVLDIGCGTGLNFPGLLDAIGESGRIVGVDRSGDMLTQARGKTADLTPGRVSLVEADAEELNPAMIGGDQPFDAVLFTYTLSLMEDWATAWDRATDLVRPGGRAAIVDMQLPRGPARLLGPVARLACWLGGADINAHPWTVLEQAATQVQSWSLRGGHVQVRVGTMGPLGHGRQGNT